MGPFHSIDPEPTSAPFAALPFPKTIPSPMANEDDFVVSDTEGESDSKDDLGLTSEEVNKDYS